MPPTTDDTAHGKTGDAIRADNAAERHRLIAERAYFIAEQDGFDPAHTLDNWLEAERQILAWLKARGTPL